MWTRGCACSTPQNASRMWSWCFISIVLPNSSLMLHTRWCLPLFPCKPWNRRRKRFIEHSKSTAHNFFIAKRICFALHYLAFNLTFLSLCKLWKSIKEDWISSFIDRNKNALIYSQKENIRKGVWWHEIKRKFGGTNKRKHWKNNRINKLVINKLVSTRCTCE